MLDVLKQFLGGKSYQPLNKIYISRQNLFSNFKYLSKLKKRICVAPVLKSNAYGHGIVEIGKLLDPLGAPFFCVDSIFEGYQLTRSGIKTPILIMGYVDPVNLKRKHLNFQYAVWDVERIKALNKYQKGAQVHIFVDTGMSREGVPLSELEDFLKEVIEFKNIEIVGLMSHFASANEKNNPQTALQIKNFQKALSICKKVGVDPRWKHLSASAGLLNTQNAGCNIARAGKALYGIDPMGLGNPNLKPVLKMTSTLVQIKKLQRGDKVGYGGTYKASKNMTLGILPLGYNDGLDRRLSNKGIVNIQGIECPIIGMVSMNITAINLSKVKNPKMGDEVVIYSDKTMDKNSISNTAKICGTTPYDIMVNLVSTTRRVLA